MPGEESILSVERYRPDGSLDADRAGWFGFNPYRSSLAYSCNCEVNGRKTMIFTYPAKENLQSLILRRTIFCSARRRANDEDLHLQIR